MTEHASYVLAAYETFLSFPEEKLSQIGRNNEDSNPIPSFDEKLLIDLCSDAINIFKSEDILLKIKGDFIVVGDIHGNIHDLLRILKFVSNTPSKVIFLGDYVDRGNFSLECITLLFSFKIIYPEKYYLIRGNHEFDSMCSQYGFKKAILNNHNPKKVENFVPTIVNNNEPKTINLDQEREVETETTEMFCDSYFANHSNIYCYKYTENLYNAFLDAFSYLPI